jgi:hypothetical protein
MTPQAARVEFVGDPEANGERLAEFLLGTLA